MATIFIDGKPYEVKEGQNLLQASLELGYDLPYFCWHPAMGSVGACRQCAVKQYRDEHDGKGKLIMACMTPAAEGTRISIRDPEAAAFRAGIIEGMMANHPHDCPVCDEGGECHLQDMTVMTGHDYRRYRFAKRTFRNQYLGPFINHEMNRCIQCYRCVRFYREYAGGRDLNAFALRNTVYFGRDKDGVLENEFSGNLVEVCPTGVFTDATLKRHYTRKWDLQMSPSVCMHCALGCNTSAGERYGVLRRIINRYNGDVNGWFLCDRGRFGYEYVNSERRIRAPLLKVNGRPEVAGAEEAAKRMGAILAGNRKVIGIGSPRASLESNFALRTLVGPDRFYCGMSDPEYGLVRLMIELLRRGPAQIPTLREIESCDAVFVVGEDVTSTAPRMALGLRQSVRQEPMRAAEKMRIPLWLDHAVRELTQDARGPLFVATPSGTRLDDIAARTFRGAPDDIARLAFAVAHAIDSGAPAVPDLSGEMAGLAGRIAAALSAAQRPLIVSGPGCHNAAVLQAAANVAKALCAAGKPAGLGFTAFECNSFGLALMGGGELGAAVRAVNEGAADTVVVVENDLYRRMPAGEAASFLGNVRHLIVLDSIPSETASAAELVLPAGTFAESDGTVVSSEGRAQRFFQVLPDRGEIHESWRWLLSFMLDAGRGRASGWRDLDDVIESMAAELPSLAGAAAAAPLARTRADCQKVAREPHRYSGRTAMSAGQSVHEPKPPSDRDAPLRFSMEGWPAPPPPPLIPFFWWPGWNSIQSTNKFQREVNGPLRGGDPGVRLIEPESRGQAPYGSGVPGKFAPRPDEWLVAPLYHIFGSEELSRQAPAVAERSARPYVMLSGGDAARLQAAEGSILELRIGGLALRVPLMVSADIPDGTAGIPYGPPEFRGIQFPAWSRIERV